jgi:hypothetical protein
MLTRNNAEVCFMEQFNVRCENEFDCEGEDRALFRYLTDFYGFGEMEERFCLLCSNFETFK